MNVLYEASAICVGGRGGHVKSSDGALDIALSVPKGLGGPGGPGTNPEQLFAAGYSACFESALRRVAADAGKTISGSAVTADVGIGKRAEGGFGLEVTLKVALEGISREEASEIAEKAHASVCPYSNAVRGNVDVRLIVV